MGHTNKHITTCTSSHSELWLKLCLRNLHDNAARITVVLPWQNLPRTAACWLGIWEPPFCAGLGKHKIRLYESMAAAMNNMTIWLNLNMKGLWTAHYSLQMPDGWERTTSYHTVTLRECSSILLSIADACVFCCSYRSYFLLVPQCACCIQRALL